MQSKNCIGVKGHMGYMISNEHLHKYKVFHLSLFLINKNILKTNIHHWLHLYS